MSSHANPEKPESAETQISRRGFFSWCGLGWVAFSATIAGSLAMMGRFMFPNVLFEDDPTFKAGYPEDYPIGEVSLRWKESKGIWIVRTEEKLYALLAVCPHLGCTPNWLPSENKFKCPCHGSGFQKSGTNFEGPSPRSLERVRIARADDGQILIDKSRRFRAENGEWNHAESYLLVS